MMMVELWEFNFHRVFVYDTHDLCVRAAKRLTHINCNFFFSVVCVSFMHIKFQVDKLLSDSHTMKGTTAVNFNLFIQSLVYFYRRRSWLILCFVLVFAEHCTFSIHSMRWGCFMSTNSNRWRNPNVGVFYPVSLLHGRLQKKRSHFVI